MWQDNVMTVGALVLVAGMIPMVRAKVSPPIQSTLPIGCVLTTYALVMSTLGLWLSAITTGVQAVLWFVLVYKARRRRWLWWLRRQARRSTNDHDVHLAVASGRLRSW